MRSSRAARNSGSANSSSGQSKSAAITSSATGTVSSAGQAGDVGGQHVERLAGARHGQQVPGLAPARPHERDVLAHQRRVERLGAGGELGDPRRVERLGAAQRQPDAVRDHRHPPRTQVHHPSRWTCGRDRLGDDLAEAQVGHVGDPARDLGPPTRPDAVDDERAARGVGPPHRRHRAAPGCRAAVDPPGRRRPVGPGGRRPPRRRAPPTGHAGTPLRRHRASRDAGPPTDAAVLPPAAAGAPLRGTSTSATAPATAAAAATPAAAASPARRATRVPARVARPVPPPVPAFIRCTASSPAIAGSDAHTADIPKRPIPSAAPDRPVQRPVGAFLRRERVVLVAQGRERAVAAPRAPRRRGQQHTATIVTGDERHDQQPDRPRVRDAREQPQQPQPGHGEHPPAGAADPAALGLGEQQARVDQPPLGRRERVGHPVVVRDPLAVDRASPRRRGRRAPARRARRPSAVRPARCRAPTRSTRAAGSAVSAETSASSAPPLR